MKAERNLIASACAAAPLDEATLVERLKRGEPAAAREFYELYAARIHRFILHALGRGNDSDADDLLQDTFMALADALPFFRGQSSLFTFACAIAHRKTVSLIRKRARRGQVMLSEEQASLADRAVEHEDRDLHRALEKLRPEHREALVLKYVEEMTAAEIAAVLSLSEHAVESRLARARKALARALEGQ
jgi:RNA polymerase sigma factor (sigma-70 family)